MRGKAINKVVVERVGRAKYTYSIVTGNGRLMMAPVDNGGNERRFPSRFEAGASAKRFLTQIRGADVHLYHDDDDQGAINA